MLFSVTYRKDFNVAIIFSLNNGIQTLSYLKAYHCFGRSTTNVDTVIDTPEISRIHAVIEWTNEQWFIRDVSSNGTWLNNQKLTKDSSNKLTVGDSISFAKANAHCFTVQDLTRPQNMLFATSQTKKQSTFSPIILTDDNLLPSEEAPEISLFYVQSKNQWYKEHLDDADGVAYPVADLDILNFSENSWQLRLNNLSENTVQLAKTQLLAHQIKYRFNLSQDEETTELTITTKNEHLFLSNKAHHYLTLSLARHRNEDATKGIDEYSQGWRLPEIMAKELGCDIQLFTTHISRAKKQFREVMEGACDGNELIERKGNKIRFAGSFYRIYKGNELIVNHGQNKVSLTVLHG